MKYFCPMCLSRFDWDVGSDKYTKRHSHEKIAFAVDPDSEALLAWVSGLQLPAPAQDETRLNDTRKQHKKAEADAAAQLEELKRLSAALRNAEGDSARQAIRDEMSEVDQWGKKLAEALKEKERAVRENERSIDEVRSKGNKLLNTLIQASHLGKEGSATGKPTSGLLVGVPVQCSGGYRINATEADAVAALWYAYEVAKNESVLSSGMAREDLDRAKAILDTLEAKYRSSQIPVMEPVYIPEARAKREPDPNGKLVWYNAGRLQKVCGVCRHPLYAHAGLYPEIVIGLLGSERVGKSTVIAATIHAGQSASRLWKGKSDNWYLNFPVEGDDALWDSVMENLLVQYEKGRAVEKTRLDIDSHQYCVSLTMTVPGNRSKVAVTFVDLPGEYLNGRIDLLRAKCMGLFNNVDVYWLCLDIVQLQSNNNLDFMNKHGYNIETKESDTGKPKTREQIEKECDHHIIHPNRFGGLQAIKDGLNNFKGRAAIILTKSDDFPDAPLLFNPNLPPVKSDAPIYDVSGEEGGLGLLENKFVRESSKVLKAAYEDYPAWPEILEDVFPEHAFFSMSAYGFTPVPRESSETRMPVKPYRTRWPMLWTLAILGYLDVKIIVRQTERNRDIDKVVSVRAKLNGGKLEREAYESLCGQSGWKTRRHIAPPKEKKKKVR